MVTIGGITWPEAPAWRAWRHVTKLDPDRPLDARTLDLVYASGTDAIMVGGSTGITQAAVLQTLTLLQDAPVPVALEVSTFEAAMPGPALFLIPLVLNTPDPRWLGQAHTEALARLLPVVGPVVPWHLLLPEAYLVLNPDSSVARLTSARTSLTADEAAAHAAFAGQVLRLPLLYVEYSGTFGDMALVRAIKANAGAAHIIYGGGISGAREASEAAAIADTIVVGNLVYNAPRRLRETVAAVR